MRKRWSGEAAETGRSGEGHANAGPADGGVRVPIFDGVGGRRVRVPVMRKSKAQRSVAGVCRKAPVVRPDRGAADER